MEPNNYPYYPPHYNTTSTTEMTSLQIEEEEAERRNSLLLSTEPKDLDKLFDTNRSLEQDICFPSNEIEVLVDEEEKQQEEQQKPPKRRMTSATTIRHSTENCSSSSTNSFDGINLSALSLFNDIHSPINSPLPKNHHYYNDNNRQEEKKKLLSLYGDNNNTLSKRNTATFSSSKNNNEKQQQQEHYSTAAEDEDRFTYYHIDTGYIKGKSLVELKIPAETALQDLLLKENYWIDITSPSNEEMKAISKLFHIHPLTTEDIMSHEIREKCDVFRHYMFVCYRAFLHDHHQQLRPVTFYNIVTKRHILTLHFDQVPHVHHVQQRVKQLQDYIEVVPDWINYAIMDEITDSFAPMIQQIESEVDAIDDLVLLYKTDQSDMILRIGTCRKKVIQMVRLLGTKVEVVRGLLKKIEERSFDPVSTSHNHDQLNIKEQEEQEQEQEQELGTKIYPDVGLYLGDVQDHILTMLQNLNHYETVLARSESNYLARVSIELTQTSNSTNHVIGRLTIFATVLLPMNLVTGLWGMNVKVPGKDYDNLIYFFWIVLSLAVFAILSLTFAKRLKLI